jgi:hypothetical protein
VCEKKEGVLKKLFLIPFMFLFVFVVSCGDPAPAKEDLFPVVDEDETVDEEVIETPDEPAEEEDEEEVPKEFDPDNPGYTVDFVFLDMFMMGDPMNMIVGYVMKTAREDLKEEVSAVTQPLNTCVMGESAPRVPECTSHDDCAPEQECHPRTDNNGAPIANSERCITPDRESLDVGPIVISGFAAGQQTFLYEPGDQVYKLNGQGDGSVDPSLMTYSADYGLYAENPTPADLDTFSGEFYIGSKFELTSHQVVQGDMFPTIHLDVTQPMTFTWTPSGMEGTVEISITAAETVNSVKTVSCLVEDNGSFTIPFEFASQLIFGTGMMAQMANMLTMSRDNTSYISGDTVSAGKITLDQIVLVNITAVVP